MRKAAFLLANVYLLGVIVMALVSLNDYGPTWRAAARTLGWPVYFVSENMAANLRELTLPAILALTPVLVLLVAYFLPNRRKP